MVVVGMFDKYFVAPQVGKWLRVNFDTNLVIDFREHSYNVRIQ